MRFRYDIKRGENVDLVHNLVLVGFAGRGIIEPTHFSELMNALLLFRDLPRTVSASTFTHIAKCSLIWRFPQREKKNRGPAWWPTPVGGKSIWVKTLHVAEAESLAPPEDLFLAKRDRAAGIPQN